LILTGASVASDKCSLKDKEREQARDAFKSMLPPFPATPRCANCHGAINIFDENTKHPGGPMEFLLAAAVRGPVIVFPHEV
jgi:hypothetical protein